ncbi:MAG: hypothetical protein FJ221_18940, partial [Lentisphaerae bacterium]|nr:hypothetical protein [Lentisphaerota bacterium]
MDPVPAGSSLAAAGGGGTGNVPPPRAAMPGHRRALRSLAWCIGFATAGAPAVAAPDWAMAMASARDVGQSMNWHGRAPSSAARMMADLGDRFPVEADWLLQDAGPEAAGWFDARADVAFELRLAARARADVSALLFSAAPGDPRWLEAYAAAAAARREAP